MGGRLPRREHLQGQLHVRPALHITAALPDTLAKLNAEALLVNLPPSAFAARAAFFLGEINAIHPFREGNGRAQREFIRQLALHAGHPLSWAASRRPRCSKPPSSPTLEATTHI